MQRLFLFILILLVRLLDHAQAQTPVDVLHYRFMLELSDVSDSVRGRTTVRIKAPGPIASFDLDLGGPHEGKGMTVEGVWRDTSRLRFAQGNDRVTCFLTDTLQAGAETEVTIRYSGIPADGLIISRNKYGDRTFFADNWPNRAHFWIPCRDIPADKASFEFIVTAPSRYRVVSNGVRLEERALDNGCTTTHWQTRVALPTKVMVIGVAPFAVKEFPDSPDGIPVSAWVFHQDSAKGVHDYAPAAGMVKFYAHYIAPYPYEKLANVQSKTIFGGMENASAIFYFENSVTGRGGIEDLLAHEIAHQWFGDMASEKSFSHLWLSEGFATYLTDIYWQQQYGEAAFSKRLAKERKKVIDYDATTDRPVVDSITPLMELLNPNSYEKGAWVLHMLRGELGDSVFHRVIQTYYRDYRGGNADTRDFEAVAEKVSGKDLKWFFDQWLYRPGIPQLALAWKTEGNFVRAEIRQQNSLPYRFPLEIGVVARDGKMTVEKVLISSRQTELKWKISSGARRLVLDPGTRLLFSDVSLKR